MTYQIDSNIPAPANAGQGGATYPWHDMKVGDSFFVRDKPMHTLSAAAGQANKRMGKKFIVRVVTENGQAGCRVWRIA